jgi:sigma-B regulation protein RsbU (phosphoserine phosphatase)
MVKPPIPADEEQRLEDVRRTGLLDTGPEEVFDRVTAELARLFDVPVATMSLVDRDLLFFKSQCGLPADLARSRVLPRDVTLCGHVVGSNETIVVDDLNSDERFADNPIVVRSGARFYAGTPLRSESGRPVGSLCIIDTKPRTIGEHERRFLQMIGEAVMTEVRLRRITRELADLSERLSERTRAFEEDLGQAQAAQRFLLPPSEQAWDGCRVCHVYRPYAVLGGDFLDVHRAADGTITAIIADVAGHGASAALISAMLKAAFHRAAESARLPEDLLTAIGRDLAPGVETGRFITAAVAVFRPTTGLVSIASAGHPHPLLLGGPLAGSIETENDLPLLIDPGRAYKGHVTLPLEPGSFLLFYTDGAPEAGAPERELGVTGLLKLALARAGQRGAALLEGLYDDIAAYAGQGLRDDVALLCLERLSQR